MRGKACLLSSPGPQTFCRLSSHTSLLSFKLPLCFQPCQPQGLKDGMAHSQGQKMESPAQDGGAQTLQIPNPEVVLSEGTVPSDDPPHLQSFFCLRFTLLHVKRFKGHVAQQHSDQKLLWAGCTHRYEYLLEV